MPAYDVNIDGVERSIEAGTTGTTYFAHARGVIAMKVDGTVVDLSRQIPAGAAVEPVTRTSPEGLAVLRHSATHVLAQAVQSLFPSVHFGIGPAIEDGFYYDFDVERAFTPEDLRALEKIMARIVAEGQAFRRRVVSEQEARREFADQPFKLELIGLKGRDAQDVERRAPGASVEVGGAELTVYDNVRADGTLAWRDLCRGPHVPSTRDIGDAFALTRTAAAYWRGSEKNPQLQRIYGTAWASRKDLQIYQHRQAEAARRDHRKLGAELDLFSFPEEIGPGLPVFHPKGATVLEVMQDYSRKRHFEAGYSFVRTPHITKAHLFEVSGHLSWYKDAMFPPMHVDEERDAQGNVTREGQDYYLKPMNCPMHNLIFRSRGRSYRELPLRLFEFGTVYRYEKSGVVQGLTRVRGLTQDDSHIYCTHEQMKGEIANLLRFVLDLLGDFGLHDFYLELSTKDPTKFVGSDEVWEEATRTLREVAVGSGLELRDDPGGAAFYGPKISVQARDAIGRTWQISTIQLDFNEPRLFGLQYTAADGSKQMPVMIHRALFGSLERFFAILLEHYAGAFPAWLAPVQVRLVPVADAFDAYVRKIGDALRARGVRVEVDLSEDRFGKKIRNAAKEKVPFVLIAGGEDAAAGAVSFRFRDGHQERGVPVDRALARIVAHIEARRNDDDA